MVVLPVVLFCFFFFFFFNDTATTEIYTLSLHDALPICLFDSHSLLKLFQREAGYEKVVRLLEQARRSEVPKYLNAINLGEIVYSTKRAFGDQKKIEVLA